MSITEVIINKSASAKVVDGYPWIFLDNVMNSSAIEISSPADIMHIFDPKGRFVCSALLDKNSKLVMRKISDKKIDEIDSGFFKILLSNALKKRQKHYTEAYYRLVNYEGDMMPGISIDRFSNTLKIVTKLEFYKLHISELKDALIELLEPEAIVFEYMNKSELIHGSIPDDLCVIENNIRYKIDLLTGQKTGWYYDQRENRALIQKLSHKAHSVLDVFCYSGGFGLNALKGGAAEIYFIDSSKDAIELTKTNIALNKHPAQHTIAGDAIAEMNKLYEDGLQFDLIILDPPPMIQNQKHKTQALGKYKKIAAAGIKLLSQNGMLLYSTCSHHMTAKDLRKIIHQVAPNTNVLETTTHAKDHPIHPNLPETLYLNSILVQNC